MSSSNDITPNLHENPSINLPQWKLSIYRFARTLMSRHDAYGLLFLVAPDPVWNALPDNILPPDGAGNPVFRARPAFPAPAPHANNATNAVLKSYDHERQSHMGFLEARVILVTALAQSIG